MIDIQKDLAIGGRYLIRHPMGDWEGWVTIAKKEMDRFYVSDITLTYAKSSATRKYFSNPEYPHCLYGKRWNILKTHEESLENE